MLRNWIRHFRKTHFFRLKLAVTSRKRRRMTETRFIAITGSSTKSTTSALLRQILSAGHKVAYNELSNGISSVARTIRKAPLDADFAVLEVAAGPGTQIDGVARLARPHMAIVTMVDLEHYAAFRTKEAVAHEKGHLVAALPRDGVAFLNADDDLVMSMAARTTARVVTFGRGEDADYRASNVSFDMHRGLRLSVERGGRSLDVSVPLFGSHFYLPVLAAVACAMELGIPDDVIVKSLAAYRGLVNRCGVIPVTNGPVFVCDTQKAPYHSITLPMDTFGGLEAPRKTIVIGQISDYAGNPKRKYSSAIAHAASVADRVFAVGPNAHKWKPPSGRPEVEFASFPGLEQLAEHLHDTQIEGELILLKSAQNIHLERLVLSFLTQVSCWTETCRQKGSCFTCGLQGMTYPEQPRARLERRRMKAQLGDGDALWRQGSLFARYIEERSRAAPAPKA